MKYLRNTATDPHFNMAFDEYCLGKLQADEPVFYLCQNRPSVIIGLNQNPFAEVDIPYMEAHNILLARRVTGGGAVYHDLQNLNYTITGRIRDLETDYPAYLETMVRALRRLGVSAELSGRNDILVDGRKCSGYAKRVYKDRLMIHGTLMYDVDIDTLTKVLSVPGSKLSAAGVESVRSRVANLKDYLPQFGDIHAFQAALQNLLSEGEGELPLSPSQLNEIESDALFVRGGGFCLQIGEVTVNLGTDEWLAEKLLELRSQLPSLRRLRGTLHLEDYDGEKKNDHFTFEVSP